MEAGVRRLENEPFFTRHGGPEESLPIEKNPKSSPMEPDLGPNGPDFRPNGSDFNENVEAENGRYLGKGEPAEAENQCPNDGAKIGPPKSDEEFSPTDFPANLTQYENHGENGENSYEKRVHNNEEKREDEQNTENEQKRVHKNEETEYEEVSENEEYDENEEEYDQQDIKPFQSPSIALEIAKNSNSQCKYPRELTPTIHRECKSPEHQDFQMLSSDELSQWTESQSINFVNESELQAAVTSIEVIAHNLKSKLDKYFSKIFILSKKNHFKNNCVLTG